jgi:X-X-X-Leu-X-X-Gly heptad repeat protein
MIGLLGVTVADSACGPSDGGGSDAPVSTVPTSPAGQFAVTSTLNLAVPPVAAPLITLLTDATDGPDDPSHYLLDQMVATLPDGTIKTIAGDAVPYVAAYLNAQVTAVAPKLVSGIDQLANGMNQIASQLGTTERWTIDAGGATTRTITGLRFVVGGHETDVRLADAGLGDITASTQVAFDAGARMAIGDHTHALPYGAWLRLGVDLAVVPSVAPAAHDLASALGSLLDCEQLGTTVASKIGVGSPALYTTACQAAMTVLASQLYAQLATIDQTAMTLEVTGVANGVDRDGDGSMDQIEAGEWTGTLHAGADEPISAASFAGMTAAPAP